MDLLTSAMKSLQRSSGPGERLAKVAGVNPKTYASIVSRNDNAMSTSPNPPAPNPGLVVTGWKGLSPAKKGIVVALYHMENTSRWSSIDFASLADANELYLFHEYDNVGTGVLEVLESALNKAKIPFKKIERSSP